MKKLVYYLGAGASCYSLPLVMDFEERMLYQRDRLINLAISEDRRKMFNDLDKPLQKENSIFKSAVGTQRFLNVSNTSAFIDYTNCLLDFAIEAREHASIDTLAKKYSLTDKHRYRLLKNVLTLFLTIEQLTSPPDPRYDAFFASILGNSVNDLPKNLRIVSWNYDLQFELAYMRYMQNFNLQEIQNKLGVQSKGIELHNNSDSFKIYKINGSIHWQQNETTGSVTFPISNWREYSEKPSLNSGQLNSCIRFFEDADIGSKQGENGLSFSWEKDSPFNVDQESLLQVIQADFREASDIVVIGYSFPFFNREIDSKLFSQIGNSTRVYFQTLDAQANARRLEIRYDNLGETIPIEASPRNADGKWKRGDLFHIPTSAVLAS